MIHQYRLGGYNIVIDRASGSIHIMDNLAFDMLKIINIMIEDSDLDRINSPREVNLSDVREKLGSDYKELLDADVQSAFKEICELYDDGSLFSEDVFEGEETFFSKIPTVIKAACLNVSHDCNLACKYCFAKEGEYHGDRQLMGVDIGERALEFLVENSGTRKNLEVDFFGGEPLMNFEVVKKLVAYGRSIEEKKGKHFRFTLTTNGMLLNDEFCEFAQKELDNVVLSMDGREDVHNYMRPLRGGGDSYQNIVNKISKFVKNRQGKKHYIRGTFTKNNLDFSKDILHMADLGYKEISMEPVVSPETEDYAITKDDVPIILDEYETLALEMARRQGTEKEFNFFHFMIDLSGGPCVYKRLSGCGAGSEYIAITPNGDIYPCHQFVGMEEFVIGNVNTGISNEAITKKFKSTNVYSKKECKNCFANMYCSGGCMANAYNSTGKIDGVYEIGCELERKRVECAIMLEVNKVMKKTQKGPV